MPYSTYLDSHKLTPLIEMIGWLVNTGDYTRQQAYVIISVARDIRIGNLVGLPNYAVSTICPLKTF